MSRPDDIPQDAWDAALKCAETVCRNLDYANVTIEVTAIARAIMAAKAEERERCAGLAESLHLECTDNHGDLYDGDVAEAIRKRGETE